VCKAAQTVTHRKLPSHWYHKFYVAVPAAQGPFGDLVSLLGNVFLVAAPACYDGIRRFIPLNVGLRWIQYTLSYPISLEPVVLLSPTACGFFPTGFPNKMYS